MNPARRESPWYPAHARGELETPDWTFRYTDLRRFADRDCAAAASAARATQQP